MSCAGKGYGTNPQSNGYLNAQFTSMISTNNSSTRVCRKFNGFYPSFTPILYNLSVTFSSQQGAFLVVYVTGANFLPNGSTYICFGGFGNVQPVYYSSYNLSFVVPLNAPIGVYNVQAVNVYNGNFSPNVNQSYPPNLNYSNAISFEIMAPPVPVHYLSVAVGNGTNGNIAYSLDGFTWTSSATTAFTQGQCICWNNNLWVAGGDTGFAFSIDGIQWSVGNGPPGFVPYGFGFNKSLWMAAGTNNLGTTMCYSFDGITWSALPSIAGATVLYDVEYNGTLWVTVGNRMFYSYGAIWVPVNTTLSNIVLFSVAWNGVMWVAVGQGGTITYSSNGINWVVTTPNPLLSILNTVAWNGTMWVAIGNTSTESAFAYSYNGINWTIAQSSSIFNKGYGVVWAATSWIAVGMASSSPPNNTIGYSYDGQNWYGAGNTALTVNGYRVASTYVPRLLTVVYYWAAIGNILRAKYTVIAPQVYTTSVLPTTLIPAPSIVWTLSGNKLITTWNITVKSLTINPSTTSSTTISNNHWYIDTSRPNTIFALLSVQMRGLITVFST